MALWLCDVVATTTVGLWSRGSVAHGFVALWRRGSMVLWLRGL